MVRLIFVYLKFLSLMVFGSIQADEGKMHAAEVFYDAGEYTEAHNIYVDVLEDDLKGWQQAIVHYDIGTVLLTEGKLKKAMAAFQDALSSHDRQLSPFIFQRLQSNKALARLMLVKQGMDMVKERSRVDEELYSNLIAQLSEWQLDIQDAEEAACALAKAEGAQECSPTWEIEAMKKKAAGLASELIKSYTAYRTQQFSLQKGSPLGQALQHLLISYDLIRISPKLEEASVADLIKEQTALKELLGDDGQEIYDQAQRDLSAAQQLLKSGLPIQSRLLMEAAHDEIQQLLQGLSPPKESPETTVKKAIAAERIALLLNRLRQQAQGREQISPDANALLLRFQHQVLKRAHPFVKEVIEEQELEFHLAQKRSIAPPWNEVVPLFFEGLDAADRAFALLQPDELQFKDAESWQEKSIEKWMEALEALRRKRSESSESQASQPTAEAPATPSGKKEENFSKTVRLLQEMEEDDRSSSAIKIRPANKGETRPW